MGARGRASLATVAFLSLVASCVPPREVDESLRRSTALATRAVASPEPPPPEAPDEPVVILVVLDGARWQEVFVGADPQLSAEAGVPAVHADALMPHLHALVAERRGPGSSGAGAADRSVGPELRLAPRVHGDLQRSPQARLRQQRLRPDARAHRDGSGARRHMPQPT